MKLDAERKEGYLPVGILSDGSGASLKVACKALFHARVLCRLICVRVADHGQGEDEDANEETGRGCSLTIVITCVHTPHPLYYQNERSQAQRR